MNRWHALFLACATALGGCDAVNHLREAQTSFNQAAQLDNAMRLATLENGATYPQMYAESALAMRAAYASVVTELDALESDSKQLQSIKDDKLWGIVLAMKGLSYWRLGNPDKVDAVVKEAQPLMKDATFGGRDRALISALPGLVRNQQAYARVTMEAPACAASHTCTDTDKTFTDSMCLLASAADTFSKSRQQVDGGNPVQVYLLQAQLAAALNGRDVLRRFGFQAVSGLGGAEGNANSRALREWWHGQARCALSNLNDLASQASPVDGAPQAFMAWKKLTGEEPEAGTCENMAENRPICSSF